jgi:hypothetical protein
MMEMIKILKYSRGNNAVDIDKEQTDCRKRKGKCKKAYSFQKM